MSSNSRESGDFDEFIETHIFGGSGEGGESGDLVILMILLILLNIVN